ncbi:helix-turn-helix domain-containing protein [Clostridium butyricum]|uniref:helix-turn-helix domain-containing protein n=1 Tax=Clostridium butyricum TaxID=1492 RepID=UPI00129AEBC4|nr:helix-turn-helix domain-containing protein [Clostridium butyricum]QGH20882.1 DNA-binding protein [Clostridium butyricum]QGH24923.1 DNA-binding protein [Clostridium butyricum]
METQKIEKLVISPEEFMKAYGFGRNMVYTDLLKRKDFPSFRIGKKYFINVNKLGEWFDSQCEK